MKLGKPDLPLRLLIGRKESMMDKYRNSRHWWNKKKITIPLILLALIVGISFALEPFLLKKSNEIAAKVNPEFKGHIGDLYISLLRGAIVLENVTATLKKNDREFLKVRDVAVDLAWRELFKGSILFDVVIDHFNVKVAKDIMEAVKRLPKSEKKEMKANFKVAHINIIDSEITVLDLPGLQKDKYLKVKDIHGEVTDLTQRKNTELAKYDMNATLTGKDKIKLTGNLDLAADPVRWDTNLKFTNFQLASANSALRKELPLNYKKGSVDIYSEVKSEEGKIYGYIKPFLNDVQYMGNKDEFKGSKHFFIEAIGAVANWSLENSKKKSVATRIPFIYENGAFSLESGEAITDVIEHGLLENKLVDRGVERKYKLNEKNPHEVQAQEDDLRQAKKEKVEKAKEEKEEKKEKEEEKEEDKEDK